MDRMTENEEKKQYLWGYRAAVWQMERSDLKIREMRLNQMLPSMDADGMPHAHNNSDFSGYASMLDQEERKYLKARYLRIKKCREITNRIERLVDEDEKDVLMYRYIKLMKWEDICVKMHFSWKGIHKVHSRALEHFSLE